MRTRALLSLLVGLGLLLAGPASAVTIDWVLVSDPGNAPDTVAPESNCYAGNCGAVADPYRISKYEVTNAQYAEFLNAKAAADPHGLYSANMAGPSPGGITRSGSSGSYTYAATPSFEDKPVVFVSFWDAARFTNWLNNGQGSGDTETGAYTLTPAGIAANSIMRNASANIFLPSESEWYKAAYYDSLTASYFDYPAGSSTQTMCALPGATPNTASCWPAVGTVTAVGAYTGSASSYGTFDQGGNVAEWNEDVVDGSRRGFRGGDWGDDASGLAAAAWAHGHPAAGAASIGFRVASVVPEPGTIVLVMTGLAGLGLTRKTS